MTRGIYAGALVLAALMACDDDEESAGSGGGGTTSTGGSGGVAQSNGGAGGAPTGNGGGGTGGDSVGGSPSGEVVDCDATPCDVPDTYCCQHYNQDAECLAPGTTCVYGVPLACDGPEDCAATEVCCATLDIQGPFDAYQTVNCATTCDANDERVVCGASGMCPAGETCMTSDILPPYQDCQ